MRLPFDAALFCCYCGFLFACVQLEAIQGLARVVSSAKGAKGNKTRGAVAKELSAALATAVAAGVRDGQVFTQGINLAEELGAELPDIKESTLSPLSERMAGARLSRGSRDSGDLSGGGLGSVASPQRFAVPFRASQPPHDHQQPPKRTSEHVRAKRLTGPAAPRLSRGAGALDTTLAAVPLGYRL